MLTQEPNRLIRKFDSETLWIEAWGDNALRVRATRSARIDDENWALLPAKTGKAAIRIGDNAAEITNGAISARINKEGWISFHKADGSVLLEEYWRNRAQLARYTSPLNISGRDIYPIPGGAWQISQRFEAIDGEKIFGLGQYQDGLLDKKGTVLELAHRNAQSSVPFAISSRGYGFLWNNPAVGRVNFARNITEWFVQDSRQLDYWICAGDTPAAIAETYAEATGTVPMMPEYGLGFTQCKMRYRTQDELLTVAREHHKRGLPMDMIVADFFHWTLQGDWKFDPAYWPDVPGMVKELKSMGIELMVSIWPTVDSRSENFGEMVEKGYLIGVDRGLRINMNWMGETVFFDATNPGARDFIWAKAKENYYKHGIRCFWLDEAEPEFGIYDFDIYRYHTGPALQVTNTYPVHYAQAFYEGLKAAGEANPMNLVRTAWAGSQRFGALVWSGDVHSSFRSMREQLTAGISISLAGIPWWTSDIGGFHSGYPDNADFRELLVRWFQWGAFCPVFRLHGDRLPYQQPFEKMRNGVQQFGSGYHNEVWSFGDEAYPILVKYLKLRERLKPYVRELMKAAHEKGSPIMRPLFYEFPADARAWEIEDSYLFGPDVLVAPILAEGQRDREVYLPAGAKWHDAWSGKVYEGGQTVKVPAALDTIPLFVKNGRALPIRE